jgi:hypothetical protein
MPRAQLKGVEFIVFSIFKNEAGVSSRVRRRLGSSIDIFGGDFSESRVSAILVQGDGGVVGF